MTVGVKKMTDGVAKRPRSQSFEVRIEGVGRHRRPPSQKVYDVASLWPQFAVERERNHHLNGPARIAIGTSDNFHAGGAMFPPPGAAPGSVSTALLS